MILATAAATILFLFDPSRYGFYPICYLHAFTGLNCPGCGAARAMHELLHAHVVEAAHLNLLVVLCLPYSVWQSMRCALAGLRARPPKFQIRRVWLWSFAAACVCFTILRNLPGFEGLAR